MTIDLMKITEDERSVIKTPITVSTINVVLKTEVENVLSPILEVTQINYFADVNYAYIPTFGRYYFVTPAVLYGGRCQYRLRVDPLTTYAAQILTLRAHMVRAEQTGITEIPDNQLPISQNRRIRCIEFSGSDFNIDTATNTSYNFVLNVAGGAQSNAGE